MKQMVDLAELTYYAYIAIKNNLDLDKFLTFLVNYPDESTEHVVQCGECNHYDMKARGYCKYWESYNHLPTDFCNKGDDTAKNYS